MRDELGLVDVGAWVLSAVQKLIDELLQPKLIGSGMDGNGMQHRGLRVLKVSRNENRHLYERYQYRSQRVPDVDTSRPREFGEVLTQTLKNEEAHQFVTSLRLDSRKREVLLMHGTPRANAVSWRYSKYKQIWEPGSKVSHDPVRAILKQGFDARVAGSGMLGRGIYCAERPCKSDRYALRYSASEEDTSVGERAQLFLCRAALGRPHVALDGNPGLRELRRPPCVRGHSDEFKCDHERLDSVVFAKPRKYREFVLYDGDQVFPEFLVEYERV
mmetsp:Transcript_95568/g.308277  ORF Transcript_95568/g.308277 Transcript_95568/m.308277 type:complete len:273 (-) Transcript_95568:225-1043(-)